MVREKNSEAYDYDRIIQKYSKFFRNSKYKVYDLEKIIFLIEMKIEFHNELKPKIVNPLEIVLKGVMTFIIAATFMISLGGLLGVGLLAAFMYIGIYFMTYRLKVQTIDQVTEYKNTKKKYLIIRKCIENEIERRKE
ncbi:hypothetical protein [Acetobacterium woodii]|uniref:Uncharacterized protein n=1 Tax=Acetobacterium woodii (strain ATCC 29683 / DSM 1030 / JCM 2381 / KCTC 1655 / WB1) TaxID=931626 RepID=H6LKT9_ACEWD|nr:hypothetical protein [Acetobacterium woodii]AFA50048.1 hypothetical protein Awo_c33200 [Acetobacterium woodii DSM 1030]